MARTGDTGGTAGQGRTAVLFAADLRSGGFGAPDASGLTAALNELAALYLDGTDRVILALEDAADAALKTASRSIIGQFNTLVKSRDLTPLRLGYATPEAARAQGFVPRDEAAEDAGRRALLLRAAETLADADDADDTPSALTQLQRRNGDRTDAIFAAVARIVAARCNGCDACMAICPTEALTQIKDKDGAVIYRCDAAACDSCGLCFDVCDSNAIEITEMKPAPADIVLDCWRCPACGVDVHEPSLRNNAGNQCRICRETGHHRKLFQVLT